MRINTATSIMITIALLATACGTSGNESTDPVTVVSSSESPSVGATSGPSGPANPSGSASASFGTDGGQNYDPHTSINPFVQAYLRPVYDTLVRLGDDGSLEPGLAESWEYSDEGLTLTLVLRQGVVFQDGEPLDAEAVRANLERAMTVEGSTVAGQLSAIDSVEVVDDSTVALKLSTPTALIPGYLADRPGMLIAPSALDNDDLDLNPVGAGPYRVDQVDPGVSVSYTLFEDYWDASVQTLESFDIVVLENEAGYNALQDGRVDAALLGFSQVPQAESAGFEVEVYGLNGVRIMYLNKSRPPFDDERVRLAVSYAIDRDAINEQFASGGCPPNGQPFGEPMFGYDPSLEPPAHDPERAVQLLEEAGASDLSFDVVVFPSGDLPLWLEAIQAMLAEAGITMSITELAPAELLSTFAEGGTDAYFSTFPGASDPGIAVQALAGEGATLNPGDYVDDEIADLAGQGAAELDADARGDIYHQLAARYQETAFNVSVCSAALPYALSDRLSGFQVSPAVEYDFLGATVAE